MALVTPLNMSRVATSFIPFSPQPFDLYLNIRTYSQCDPIIHCLFARDKREHEGLVYPPGLYIYTRDRRDGEELLWLYEDATMEELDGILSPINCKDVFDFDSMNALGFIEDYMP